MTIQTYYKFCPTCQEIQPSLNTDNYCTKCASKLQNINNINDIELTNETEDE